MNNHIHKPLIQCTMAEILNIVQIKWDMRYTKFELNYYLNFLLLKQFNV